MINDKMNKALEQMIKAQIKKSFIPEAQATATAENGLGMILARYFEWDGLAILKTAYAALEDSNFHKENLEIEKLIKAVESEEVA